MVEWYWHHTKCSLRSRSRWSNNACCLLLACLQACLHLHACMRCSIRPPCLLLLAPSLLQRHNSPTAQRKLEQWCQIMRFSTFLLHSLWQQLPALSSTSFSQHWREHNSILTTSLSRKSESEATKTMKNIPTYYHWSYPLIMRKIGFPQCSHQH